jgi:Flp pilus assembly pilin Flp
LCLRAASTRSKVWLTQTRYTQNAVQKWGIKMNKLKEFWQEEEGIGVVEIILILVVLIALVLVFKTKITTVVNNAFKSFENDSGSILK